MCCSNSSSIKFLGLEGSLVLISPCLGQEITRGPPFSFCGFQVPMTQGMVF